METKMQKLFLNDKILDSAEATVSANDGGLLYGMGLFETMRSVKGKVFRLTDHLDRLFASAKALSMLNTYTHEYIKDAIDKLLDANQLQDARLRLTLTNGPLDQTDPPQPTLLITATQFTPYPENYYDAGVRVILTEARQNPADPIAGHKSTCYASRLLVLSEAHKKLAADALWFTTDNRLAEGCISNVFLATDGKLTTPDLSAGILPGIARKTVIELAKNDSMDLTEKDLTINDLLAADEVFITNVVMKILPVIAIEAHTVSEGTCGPITKKLMNLFDQCLATE